MMKNVYSIKQYAIVLFLASGNVRLIKGYYHDRAMATYHSLSIYRGVKVLVKEFRNIVELKEAQKVLVRGRSFI